MSAKHSNTIFYFALQLDNELKFLNELLNSLAKFGDSRKVITSPLCSGISLL